MADLIIIGGGLAGSEAAWQAAQMGLFVDLYEMRPVKSTGAHLSGDLAELICSNSLGSNLFDRASGLLKEELRRLGSMLLDCATQAALPAGNALAVDRGRFSTLVTARISDHPRIRLIRGEVTSIPPTPAIVASGPLTSPTLSADIQRLTGRDNLFFFDAIAPIVRADSIDMNIAFRASRYGVGEQSEGDYINCPFTREEYDQFVSELLAAERISLHAFEHDMGNGVVAGAKEFFEGCLPVEIIAQRGLEALAYGPMRPVGLRDLRTNKRAHAILQLRQDNLAGTLYNLVGFQTNLTFGEQKRVFRLIPGLGNAEFVRYGQMHRNTFIASPLLLRPTLQFRHRPDLFFAGQITGVEGYMGNIATGLLAGVNAARFLCGQELLTLPEDTMLGALMRYVTQASMQDFQPMKAMFGILPPLPNAIKSKRERAQEYANRAINSLTAWGSAHQLELIIGEDAHEKK
jgi:methylenetetrahydrofolate--tRNA-(uracil-5-)-methyltransferase